MKDEFITLVAMIMVIGFMSTITYYQLRDVKSYLIRNEKYVKEIRVDFDRLNSPKPVRFHSEIRK